MGLGVGIVGLPNIGKSTTFNALTKAQNAESANYPFCTIEPNKAIVPVPDKRLDALAEIVIPDKIQHSTIDFVDIAGLVKGASKGEGLGNKFLSNIREVEVILHMVRCFEDENVVHVEGGIDPLRDIEIIETELIYADISQVEKKIDRLKKQAKFDKEAAAQLEVIDALAAHLEELKPVSSFEDLDNEHFQAVDKELRFLSNKDVIYGANVDEEGLDKWFEGVSDLKVKIDEQNIGGLIGSNDIFLRVQLGDAQYSFKFDHNGSRMKAKEYEFEFVVQSKTYNWIQVPFVWSTNSNTLNNGGLHWSFVSATISEL